MSKKRKRYTVVAGIIAVLLVAGGIVTAVSPTSKGGYTAADRRGFLAGCEQGEASASVACHCALAKAEAVYHSNDELISIAADTKRFVRAPALRRMFSECTAPKGKWELVEQNEFVAHCSAGKPGLASECACVARRTEAVYSGVELEAAETSHDTRLEARDKKWLSECASPKGNWDTADQKAALEGCEQDHATATFCHCIVLKSQAAYSFVGLEGEENSQDAHARARFQANLKRWASECARRS